jgi:RHS repeat-associated protein
LGVRVGSAVNWFVPDPHGSVAASLDQAQATVTNANRFDAYGQLIGTGGSGAVGAAYWKYQARLDLSPDSQALYDFSARLYAPGLGEFTSLDTVMGIVGDPLSLNRFLYAEANPTTLVDPTGHMAVSYVCVDECITFGTPTSPTSSTTTPSTTYPINTSGGCPGEIWCPTTNAAAPAPAPASAPKPAPAPVLATPRQTSPTAAQTTTPSVPAAAGGTCAKAVVAGVALATGGVLLLVAGGATAIVAAGAMAVEVGAAPETLGLSLLPLLDTLTIGWFGVAMAGGGVMLVGTGAYTAVNGSSRVSAKEWDRAFI